MRLFLLESQNWFQFVKEMSKKVFVLMFQGFFGLFFKPNLSRFFEFV